jgi:hypothetical protein
MMEGVNSTMTYCKNLVNVTIYPQNNKNKEKEDFWTKDEYDIDPR